MKRTLFSLFLSVVLTMPCMGSTIDSILLRLDEVVANKHTFVNQKEQDIQQLKSLYSVASGHKKYDICFQIYVSYNGFNTDSAYQYSLLCEQIARSLPTDDRDVLIQRSLIYQAQCLSINCMFEQARLILESMQDSVLEANLNIYYRAWSSVCVWEGEFSTIPEQKEADRKHILHYRQLIHDTEQDPIWQTHEQALMLAETDIDGAMALLQPIIDTLPRQHDMTRYLCNSMGGFYLRKQATTQQEMQQYLDSSLCYFAISAICDLEHGIMEHASLREVTLNLFRRNSLFGNLERTYHYMNCCIDDAEKCKARLRTIEMAGDMSVILEAYHSEIHEQQASLKRVNMWLWIALLIVCVGLAYIGWLSRRLYVARRRANEAHQQVELANEQLKQANQQLQQALAQQEESNQSLRVSNRIRAAYVTQYMTECSEVIEKIGIYRQQLLKISVQSNYQKLQEAVKSTDFIDTSLKEFYQHFDETFLSLFPHFVESLNALLRPEAQFDMPLNGHLSTELRIYALIRLDIRDSDDIARFLRLSTKTVYNYRASVRNRAINRDKLEDQVALIDL